MRPKAFSPVLLLLSFSFFLTAAELNFAQRASGQGLRAEITRVKIPRGRRPVVTFKINDSKGKPLTIKDLDRRGIRFTIATIKVGKNGATSYHNYVLQKVKGKDYVYKGEKKKPVLAETLQPDRDRRRKFVKQGKGIYNYTFRKALPADFDKNATHVVGSTFTRAKRKYVVNPLHEFVPSGAKVTVRRGTVMIGIPFGGSAIESPRILPLAVCQPPFGSRKRLSGGADSPRKPISAQTVSAKGHYVNPRLAFTQTWTFPRP